MFNDDLPQQSAEPNFKNGFMVHWSARILTGPGQIRPGLVSLIRQGGFNLEFEHALPIGKEIGIEFFIKIDSKKQRIRLKAKVGYCKLNNSGALIVVKTSTISREDNHTLNNILHTLGNSQEMNLKI